MAFSSVGIVGDMDELWTELCGSIHFGYRTFRQSRGADQMAAILQSLQRTIIAGVILLVGIIIVGGIVTGQFIRVDYAWWTFFMRWLHVLSGVMWIGLLWYFNFVQIPTVPKIEPAEHRAAITRYIAPSALFWFRYGALATVVTGLLLAYMNGYLMQALTLQRGTFAIGIGMWLALIMAFNVWFVIWPNQQKALGLVPSEPDAKAKAARVAMLTSRINTMLSIPMLYCMVAQSHGGF
jgi:uncharacterized membrane protein